MKIRISHSTQLHETQNKPGHQVVMQEQVQVPTTDLLVHAVEPLSFYQKPEDSAPQKQLPRTYININLENTIKQPVITKIVKLVDGIPEFVLQKAIAASSG